MSGLAKSLDKYKRLKAEATRTQSNGFAASDKFLYVEDLENQLIRISSTSQVSMLQQLEKSERHIQTLEDRLLTVVQSLTSLKDASDRQASELSQYKNLSKSLSELTPRLTQLEAAVLRDESESSIIGLNKRVKELESLSDLEILHSNLKRCEEVEDGLKAFQVKWETALNDTNTTFAIAHKGLEKRVNELMAVKEGKNLVSSQHESVKSQGSFDQGALELVYDIDKQLKKLQTSITDFAVISQKRQEEMMEIKRFSLETKSACSKIIEALDQKLSRVEQIVLVTGDSLQKLEQQTSKPLHLADLSTRELKSLESNIKQDLTQSITYLNELVRKNIEDQRIVGDSLKDVGQRVDRMEASVSPLQTFKAKREHSLNALYDRVKNTSGNESRSIASLKDQLSSVSFEERGEEQRSLLTPVADERHSALSRKPPKAQSQSAKSIQSSPRAPLPNDIHPSHTSPKRTRPRRKLRAKSVRRALH